MGLELPPDPAPVALEFPLTHWEGKDDSVGVSFPGVVPRIGIDDRLRLGRVQRSG